MTPSIIPLSLFADFVLSLTLAIALASPRVSQLARPAIATFVLACAWLITGVVDAVGAPAWTIFVGVGVIVASIVVMLASLHVWTQASDFVSRGGDDGGGGLRCRRPDGPQPGGAGSDPSWWPEFESQLALYVAEGHRETRKPATFPGGFVKSARPRRRSCGLVAPAANRSTGGGTPATRRAPHVRSVPRCLLHRRQTRLPTRPPRPGGSH